MTTEPRPHAGRRRGTTYVLVLAVSLIVTVIGLSSLAVGRVSLRMGAQLHDQDAAELIALSGMEYILQRIDVAVDVEESGGPLWRQQFTHGLLSDPLELAPGKFVWVLEDATGDENLADDSSDAVFVAATGTVGDASRTLKVRLEPSGGESMVGLSCLGTAMHSRTQAQFQFISIHCDQIISANQNISSNSAVIDADIETAGNISGEAYLRTTSETSERSTPGSSVFDFYLSAATPIDMTDLPVVDGVATLEGQLLSPSHNPFGAADELGLYVIDCKSLPICIRNCRIIGTILLLDPAADEEFPSLASRIEGRVCWEPAVSNFPALLVRGDMELRFDNTPLSETGAAADGGDVNFNPTGAPYQGVTDTNALGTYPSLISGLIYISDTLELEVPGGHPTIEGVLVAGKVQLKQVSDLTLRYRDTFLNNPPPGFGGGVAGGNVGRPRIVSGSFERIVN